MLIAHGDDQYRFITQPDHAALAGQFAVTLGERRRSNGRRRPPR